MKKILFILAILLPMGAWAQQFTDSILVNGKKTVAEFVVSGTDECKLGSGFNACISQYSQGSVTIPKEVTHDKKTYKVKEINRIAFRLCSKITSVNLPDGVTRVGEFAFQGCQSLEEIDLCTTLTSIGSGAFIDLPALKKVKCDATTPPVWEYNDVFKFHSEGIGSTKVEKYTPDLHVPDAAIEAYKNSQFTKPEIGWTTAEGWGNFAYITDSHGATLRITNVAEMNGFRDAVNKGIKFTKVVLEADIDMDVDFPWTVSIGDEKDHAFTGVFDGQGHTISRLNVKYGSAGLFGYLKGARIVNLNLTRGSFDGKVSGALCAETVEDESGTSYTTIDSVMVEKCEVLGASHGGGLVGKASMVNVDRTVVMNTNVYVTYSDAFLSGLLGYVKNGTANNVAVIEGELKSTSGVSSKDAFTGGCKRYVVNNSFTTHELSVTVYEHLTHDNCVYKNKDYEYKDEKGETHKAKFKSTQNETMCCVGILGLSDWLYCPNEYPLPACFEDRLPEPKANVMTLRPRNMDIDRINGLSIAEGDEKTIKWTDFSSGTGSFLSTAKFTTSRLWVDGNLTGSVLKGELPIGKTTITARQGIRYDATLNAKDTNDVYDVPEFKADDNGNLVIGDDGQPIITGYTQIEEPNYEAQAYSLFLPYQTTLPINCTVYKPVKLASDENGVATIEMEMVKDNQTEAFKPYFVLVNSEDVMLGTTHETVLLPNAGSSISLGTDYEFTGTMYAVDKDAAKDNHFYLKDADDYAQWNVMTDDNKTAVEAFSAYFRAKGTKTSKIQLTLEHVSDANFEYEMAYDEEGNDVLYVTKYKGEGGDVVVPSTVTAKVGGEERTMSVVDIEDEVFAKVGDKIRSIDLSQCESLNDLYIDRKMDGNPFYKVKETALVFLPKDNGSVGVNVVVGDECQKLLLKEDEDFYSPRDFKAKNVEYNRILSGVQQSDGTWKSKAHTVCLPFDMAIPENQLEEVKVYKLHEVDVNNKVFQFTNEFPILIAGEPYVIVVGKGSLSLSAKNVTIVPTPKEPQAVKKIDGTKDVGLWVGTFKRMNNNEMLEEKAYIIQSNGTFRCSAEKYSYMYIYPFRGYFSASEPLDSEIYQMKFIRTENGVEIGEETDFPADMFDSDGDFDGETGITTLNAERGTLNNDSVYTLDGRKLSGKPNKGIYIQNGKKIIIK